MDADEEALAVARAALESSEAESEEEPPDEQACSPDPSLCTQAPALAVDSPCAVGIRACRAVHSRQLSTDSLRFASKALLVPCASDSSRYAALQTQGVRGRAVLK